MSMTWEANKIAVSNLPVTREPSSTLELPCICGQLPGDASDASRLQPSSALLHLDGGIFFDMLLALTAIVGDSARREIDIIADDPGAPAYQQELRKRALPGLVGSERRDEGLPIERRHIRGVGKQRPALVTTELWIPAALAYGEKPVGRRLPAGKLVFDVELHAIEWRQRRRA